MDRVYTPAVRVGTLNRQNNSYEHAADYVEEVSHKLFYCHELFISFSVTFTVYYSVCTLHLLWSLHP